MELIILLVAVIGVLGWFLWKDRKFEESGSHPLDAPTKMLDVNKDGKVDLQDAVAAAEVVVEKTKKTAAKAKTTAKATAAKVKTAAKKATTKKTKK
jgi:FtsZ-interacting cell division protein ZipA